MISPDCHVNQLLYQVTMVVARRANSSLLKANAWHHRSDAMSSVIALFGIAAAQAGQSPYWDPVAAAVVSAMIVPRPDTRPISLSHTHA
jgi:divalent metal cation (Fe/Co/Zn/Cd) transporter